jgi:hypothetical protein
VKYPTWKLSLAPVVLLAVAAGTAQAEFLLTGLTTEDAANLNVKVGGTFQFPYDVGGTTTPNFPFTNALPFSYQSPLRDYMMSGDTGGSGSLNKTPGGSVSINLQSSTQLTMTNSGAGGATTFPTATSLYSGTFTIDTRYFYTLSIQTDASGISKGLTGLGSGDAGIAQANLRGFDPSHHLIFNTFLATNGSGNNGIPSESTFGTAPDGTSFSYAGAGSVTYSGILGPGTYNFVTESTASAGFSSGTSSDSGNMAFSLQLAPVPEPSSLVLAGMAAAPLAVYRLWRRRKTSAPAV